MPYVKWTKSALLDIQRLYQFLAEKNNLAAQKAIKTIRENINTLIKHPEIGRPIVGGGVKSALDSLMHI